MVYFNVTTFFVQSGFGNVMSSSKFVFSSVDFRLCGIFLRSLGTTWAPGINEIFHLGLWLTYCQRWSPRGRPWPRGQILKSLASKVKSLALASRPQVLENRPVLGSRTALFF